MAKGHLYLVLAVLLGAGPVLAINVDLREQELETQQELNLAVSRELGDVVDQAELISIKELNVSRVDSRGKKEKKNCKANGGWCKIKCDYQEAPFRCSRTHRCCLPPRSCVFDGSVWPHDSYLTEACIGLLCNDGTWEYTGKHNTNCANCTFGGEPIVYPFDPLTSSQEQPSGSLFGTYWTGDNGDVVGEYVMAQPNFKIPAEFYVNSHIGYASCIGGECIEGITYYELGINITMIHPPLSDPLVEIKVYVNDHQVTIGETVEYFSGTGGAILVFRHKHIDAAINTNCIGIVGTKGFSVALCDRKKNVSWAYILADKSTPSRTIQGLCNTLTGFKTDCFTAQSGTCVKEWWTGDNDDNSFGMDPDLINSWKFCPDGPGTC